MTEAAALLLDVTPSLTLSLALLAAIFIGAGVLHFLKPRPFVAIVPRWLPARRALVFISGAFEILGGAGLLVAATRTWAAWGLIALLVAVFPANVKMLLDAHAARASRGWIAALIVRLPLQAVLIAWVYLGAVRQGR